MRAEMLTSKIATPTILRVARSKISKAAAELGRKGGRVSSARKTAAVRANALLGGRPVKLRTIAGETVHADAELAERIGGRPAFRAKTAAAARWLERHGFKRARPGERPVIWIRAS